MTEIYKDALRLRGSPLEGMNPQPFFCGEADLPVAGTETFPDHKRLNFGRETGFRMLPYRRQDRYGRTLTEMELPLIVMENEFLRAGFVPSLGGRLWFLFDKKRNRDILYRNPVFRPANLAIRDAWFSGGIEWNVGRFGHTVHTCSPVFAGVCETEDGPALRIWEFERQTRLYWRLEFALSEKAPVLYAYGRIENPDPDAKPLYWWTNAAVPQGPRVRVLAAAAEVLYMVPGTGQVKTMGGARLPRLPALPEEDASYPAASYYSNEYFFQCEENRRGGLPYPWECAAGEDGYAYAEASTAPLLYRKMFCWGESRGGRRWQDFLSLPGQEYLEVQAGLAPTQLHTSEIEGSGCVDWVQAFTALNLEPEKIHGDYAEAAAYAGDRLAERIGPQDLNRVLEKARAGADIPVRECLALGSGWGALERLILSGPASEPSAGDSAAVPPALSFPEESAGEAEKPWAELFRTGSLPLRSPAEGPGSFVVHQSWETLLVQSLGRRGDWLTPYHLGVIAFERGETQKALSYWEQSLGEAENAWALRNLGFAALREGKAEAALDYYRRAFGRDEGRGDQSFAEEYIPLLVQLGRLDEAERGLAACKNGMDAAGMDGAGSGAADIVSSSGPLLDAAARIAFERGDDAALDRFFAAEPAHIREGNTALADLWAAGELRRLTAEGVTEAEERVRSALAAGELEPPREIDFRMYTAGRVQ
ncbi:MAG: DUF5107 domain-containing protein [Treponema sp.]|jgi:tetratricopeptide (TPR) repeat protein|nr:DUF5107 domain-containing protein [Treponema sp.]